MRSAVRAPRSPDTLPVPVPRPSGSGAGLPCASQSYRADCRQAPPPPRLTNPLPVRRFLPRPHGRKMAAAAANGEAGAGLAGPRGAHAAAAGAALREREHERGP